MATKIPVPIGDDGTILATLKKNGVAQDVSAATDVKAAIRDEYELINGSQVTCTDTGNADWTNGVVEVIFPAANTTTMRPGVCSLEIQVNESSALSTWIAAEAAEVLRTVVS
jgi:hypothetical protein